LTFVIGRVNHFYGTADRALLNRLKHHLYELVSELDAVLQRSEASFLGETVDGLFGAKRLQPYLADWRVSDFIADTQDEIVGLRERLGAYLEEALQGFGARAYADLELLTEAFPAEIRDDIRAHYLGFPYWDSTTYPARALSDLAELDEVQVVRVSPLDADRLTPMDKDGAPAPRSKLKGVAFGHFGAFFRRSWRENDYLWGRLDGAERLLWLLGDTTDESAKQAFGAITAEEAPKLTKVSALVHRVQEYSRP
jgi:hypothetical protein